MNKQTSTIFAIIAVVVVIAIAALTLRNQTSSDTTVSETDATMEKEDSMMMATDPIKDGNYVVNANESTVEWEGRKTLIADYKDSGTIRIASGHFTIANGGISGGTVTFDMTSIQTTFVTVAALGTEGLDRHLKSPDFFDVEQHPTATFAIIGSEPGDEGTVNVRGNLTIKGITKETTIPVHLGMKEGKAIATGTANVDRTHYDVRFGSDKFFDNLADNVIDDLFTLDFTLVADAQ